MTTTKAARQPELETLFEVYVMQAMDPGDFYHISNERWMQLLPEAKECYDDADQPFPFTNRDAELIRASVDKMLEDEFGTDVMREYEKTR